MLNNGRKDNKKNRIGKEYQLPHLLIAKSKYMEPAKKIKYQENKLIELLGINDFNNVFYINILNNEYKQKKISDILDDMGYQIDDANLSPILSPYMPLINVILDATSDMGYTSTSICNGAEIRGYTLRKMYSITPNLYI